MKCLLSIIYISLLIVGCSDGDSDESTNGKSDAGERSDKDSDSGSSIGELKRVTITEEGGELELGAMKIRIPEGALDKAVEIGIKVVEPPVPFPDGYVQVSDVYECTPHGIEFIKPITMRISYGDETEQPHDVLRLDDDEDESWEAVEFASFENGVASLDIRRFSFLAVVYFIERALSKPDAAQNRHDQDASIDAAIEDEGIRTGDNTEETVDADIDASQDSSDNTNNTSDAEFDADETDMDDAAATPWKTGENIRDNEGNIYATVIIGDQVWMQQNLRVTKYNNGDDIETTDPADLDTNEEMTPKYQWLFPGFTEDDEIYYSYGRLYTWYAITDPRGVCPTGWHVPSDEEWGELEQYLSANGYRYDGVSETIDYYGAGTKLAKALTDEQYWRTDDHEGTPGNSDYADYRNMTGFSATPAGLRNPYGAFSTEGLHGYWWTASKSDDGGEIYLRTIYFDDARLMRSYNSVGDWGMSVRCVND